ncbi:MAG: hypothetical protein II778_06400 [Anaerovibrio sp.]|nr:hypothetical protein [Anaerovibrio sp.]
MSVRTTEKMSSKINTVISDRGPAASVDTSASSVAFRELLLEKLDSIQDTTKKMNKLQEEIKSLKQDRKINEIIRRIMPDGSIMITEYSNGKIVSRYRKKPHMISVPDENAPVKLSEDGTPLISLQPMVLKPSRSIASELFY